jgi:hypothetical protein
MGLGTKIIIIMICVAFFFSVAPRTCGPLETGPCYLDASSTSSFNATANATSINVTSGAFFLNTNTLLLGAAGIFAIAGSILFPNPYLLFGGITLFLLSFASIPYAILTNTSLGLSLNDPLVQLMTLIFGFLMVIAALTFYKGNEW